MFGKQFFKRAIHYGGKVYKRPLVTVPLAATAGYFALQQLPAPWSAGVNEAPIASDVKQAFVLSDVSFKIKPEEIEKHNRLEDLWVVIHGKVYDLSEFVLSHPGGPAVILKYAGKDATNFFSTIHSTDIIEMLLPPEKCLGDLDGELKPVAVETPKSPQKKKAAPSKRHNVHVAFDEVVAPKEKKAFEFDEEDEPEVVKPSLEHIFSISDFEFVAKNIIPKGFYSYIATGSDDEVTLRNNHYAFQRLFFKPRVLTDTRDIDMSTFMTDQKVALPVYITAFSCQGKAHPDGEFNLTKVAKKHNIMQMIPIMTSKRLTDIIDLAGPNTPQWAQLHFESQYDLANSEKTIKRLTAHDNIKAIFINADLAAESNREKDFKMRNFERSEEFQEFSNPTNIYPTLTWDDFLKFKSVSQKPVYIKGVQTPEDIIKAAELGFRGVVISNHGGRQLDYSKAPLETLAETMPRLRQLPNYDKAKFDVYIDGGIRRGSDIIKALSLGATGVGLGRPFAYALAGYGEEGCDRLVTLLGQEIERDMKLLGCNDVKALTEKYVDMTGLYHRFGTNDRSYDRLYEPIPFPPFKKD